METITAVDFVVRKDDLREVEIVERMYTDDLRSGEVLLAIDKFAFTANNITYGVVGEQMDYWKFFPREGGFGIVPVWGIATVISSNHQGLRVGERFYGYYPMSSHLVVAIDRVSSRGFVDTTEHRRGLPAVYNFYTNIAHDPAFTPETEDLVCLFRPLFLTSFLLDDYLAGKNFFDVAQVLITSASSKTAQALACLLASRKEHHGLSLDVTGLTSKHNVAFVRDTGWYDKVLSYDEVDTVDTQDKSMIVDFAGNHAMQLKLQTILAHNLEHNSIVGIADWQNLKGASPLPQKGEFFFALTHAARQQEQWGLPEFQQKVERAWDRFIIPIEKKTSIKRFVGPKELEALYEQMLNGEVNPEEGNMASLGTSVHEGAIQMGL